MPTRQLFGACGYLLKLLLYGRRWRKDARANAFTYRSSLEFVFSRSSKISALRRVLIGAPSREQRFERAVLADDLRSEHHRQAHHQMQSFRHMPV